MRSKSLTLQPAFCKHFFVAGIGPVPMIFGSTPALAYALMVAKIGNPKASAFSLLASITAAAPSLSDEALPAVTVPSFLKAGRIPPSFSAVMPARGPSSVAKMIGSPLRCGIETGVISSTKRPASMAANALLCEAAAKASCSSRLISYSQAMFSAVIPIW